MASVQQAAKQVHRTLTGVVVSAGKMQKTVKVRIPGQKWDKHIRKHYASPHHLLVHDPSSSLHEGDIIALRAGFRASKHVHHVVTSIVAPFGPPVDQRPPIPTEEERAATIKERRRKKDERQAQRGRIEAIKRLSTRREKRQVRWQGIIDKWKAEGKGGKAPEAHRGEGEGGQALGAEKGTGSGMGRAWENSQRKIHFEEKAVENLEELEEITKRMEGLGRTGEEVVLEKKVQAGELGV